MATLRPSPAGFQPYVSSAESPVEFTAKAIAIGVIFGLIFGASTVYLGLRAGLTVSASIPIAVLAISVLKRLGGSTILENNIVQTIGSAGESVAGGVVYYVRDLKRHLRQILGLDRKLRVAIMGAGNLGLALADYPGFRQEGFEISALFDNLREKVGQQSRLGVPIHDIHDLKKIARREGIRIAVIAVPAPSAQHVLNQVVAAGVKAVLNFSPGTLQAPPDVKLKSVDLTVSLESLSFFLAQGDGEEK